MPALTVHATSTSWTVCAKPGVSLVVLVCWGPLFLGWLCGWWGR